MGFKGDFGGKFFGFYGVIVGFLGCLWVVVVEFCVFSGFIGFDGCLSGFYG